MKRGLLFTVFIGLNAACGVAMGDDAAATPRVGLPWDWSHTWVILNPDLPEEAMAKGEYAEWLRRWEDPRFKHAVIRKADQRQAMQEEAAAQAKARTVTTRKEPPQRPPPAEPPKPPAEPPSAPRTGGRKPAPSGSIHRDWSNLIGSGSGTAANFPAKYSFDINAAPDCVNDFIVVPMDAAGNPGAGTSASQTGSVTAAAGAGTITVTNGANVLTITRSLTQNTGFFFLSDANAVNQAINIAAAINRNGGVVGVASTSSGATVTVSTTRVGPQGNNVVVATGGGITGFNWNGGQLTGGSGTPSQGNLVAFNQLYKTTCDDTANPPVRRVPNTLFYYNTSTGGVVDTSPVLSMDGKQIAFTERNGTTVSLVLLKWTAAGSPGAPFTPPLAADAAAYLACTAPCMYKMSLGADNTISSPYYDYSADAIYIGDAAGRVHKFNGVFNGTPAAAGSPWPVTVSSGNQMSNAVYDQATGLVFVGSARGTASGGQLHSISSAGTVVSTGQLATNIVAGQADAGVPAIQLDSFAQKIYAYVGSDTTTNCSNKACTAVYQFPTNSSISGLTTPRSQIGQGNTQFRYIRTGAFDQAYWNSTPTSPTGFLYVCGSLSDQASERPTLWRIPITANVMGAAVVGPKLVQNPAAECSPITQVMNGSNEYLFVSVPSGGNQTGCTGSCIYMYRLNGIVWNASTAPTAGFNAPGGTSGIIIDNISGVVGNSQIYYMTLNVPGTIVQASQAALQ